VDPPVRVDRRRHDGTAATSISTGAAQSQAQCWPPSGETARYTRISRDAPTSDPAAKSSIRLCRKGLASPYNVPGTVIPKTQNRRRARRILGTTPVIVGTKS
jgi:hypothetical protein